MIRLEYKTQTQVETNRAEIAAAVAAYEAAGGQITVLDGFQVVERPKARFDYKIKSEAQQARKPRVRNANPATPRTTPERRAEIAAELRKMAAEGVGKCMSIDRASCGKELARLIIAEHGITWPAKKTLKDIADEFCGVPA